MLSTWLASTIHLLVAAALGGWLMFAPDVFGTTGSAAASDRLVGALVVTFALIAVAEGARAVRFVNVLFGAWLLIAPVAWSAGYAGAARWNALAVGAALLLLTPRRGHIGGRYGTWLRYIA